MVTKADLQAQAQDLGIELDEDDGVKEITAKIREVTEGKALPLSEWGAQSEAAFGQPRSVLVGAASAGFLSDPATKKQVESGIEKFLNYGGEG
jgi:hypothetical protein